MEEVITYRRARLEDKEGVLTIIDDAYCGRDYLPFCFDHLISDTNTKCYLAERSNEIIGFCVGYLVDDGQTIVARAARLKPSFTGKGVYKKLSKICQSDSQASKHAFTTSDRNYMSRRSLLKKFNQILFKKLFHMITTRSNIKTSDAVEPCLENISDDTLSHLISPGDICNALFPNNRIVVNFIPFRLMTSNIPLLRNHGKSVLIFSGIHDTARGMKGLLTVWSRFLKGTTLVCSADIYGTYMTSFGTHLASFLSAVTTEPWEKLDVEVTMETFVEKRFLEDVAVLFNVDEYGWTEYLADADEETYCLFEKHIH